MEQVMDGRIFWSFHKIFPVIFQCNRKLLRYDLNSATGQKVILIWLYDMIYIEYKKFLAIKGHLSKSRFLWKTNLRGSNTKDFVEIDG